MAGKNNKTFVADPEWRETGVTLSAPVKSEASSIGTKIKEALTSKTAMYVTGAVLTAASVVLFIWYLSKKNREQYEKVIEAYETVKGEDIASWTKIVKYVQGVALEEDMQIVVDEAINTEDLKNLLTTIWTKIKLNDNDKEKINEYRKLLDTLPNSMTDYSKENVGAVYRGLIGIIAENPELNKMLSTSLGKLQNMIGGQVSDLGISTRTARRDTVEDTLEGASRSICEENDKLKAHLLKADSKWICKDATCKQFGIKGVDGSVGDIDRGIVNAQCDALGLASGCESALLNCSTQKLDDCFRTLVTIGNKFGQYNCQEKRDAIGKVSPGLVRDILTHIGFKTIFRRDMSLGIDVMAFEPVGVYVSSAPSGIKQNLESANYTNLNNLLKLFVEWANAHPDMLNNALIKTEQKTIPKATPLERFVIREKTAFPGSETGDLRNVIGELTRLGHQSNKLSAPELMSLFGNASGFNQYLNPQTFGEIRTGISGISGIQAGGSVSEENVLNMLKFRSSTDSAVFGSILEEVRKMLNTKYNIDLSNKSQQRVDEKLNAFKESEQALYDSMTQAIERERVLRATGQQIDIDNASNDAERQKLVNHYTGMSKLLDGKYKRANKLIKIIQSMLKAGADHDGRKLGF